MSSTTISLSGWTYISNLNKTANYSGAANPKVDYKIKGATSSEQQWSSASSSSSPTYATVLKFARPNALKYSKITSVTLTFTVDSIYAGSSHVTTDWFAVAAYTTDLSLSDINWNSFRTGGILGDWITGGTQGNLNTPATKSVSITSLYNGDLNRPEFNIVVGMGFNSGNSEVWLDTSGTYLTVTYEAGTQPAPTPLYPKDQTLVEADTTLFAWQFNSETEAVQTAAQLEYKLTTAGSYTTLSLTQPDYSYTLNTRLAAGSYQWRVKVTNDASEVSNYSDVAYFNIVGRPASPIINEPADKALTEISWNTTNQQSCEIILADQSGKELYHETLATQENFYKPNFFLKGAYLFSVRVMNDSMMWSDWAQRAFTISAAGPAAATASLISVAGTPAVHLNYSIPSGANAVIMRSQNGIEKVVAPVDLLNDVYTDDTICAGVVYTYWIRTYINGYTDSQKLDTKVDFDGAIFSTEDTVLHLTQSDEKYLPHSEDVYRDYAILKLSGREYPMIERGEFTSVEFSRRFFVSAQQKKVLDRLCKEEAIFYRDTKENAFPAGVKNVHYDDYMAEGYLATIDLVRLHEEEVVVNV